MSNYKNLIDEAMRTAQYRLNAGVDKTASAYTESSLIKEASELANALEYMSVTAANDGSLAGQARAEMVRDFYKAATAQRLGVKLAGDVGEGPTMASGEQLIAPNSGKIKLMPKKEVAGNPMVSAAPDSKGKTMLESFKQADSAGKSLYDILMHNKEAGDVGEMSASEPAQGIPSSNENSNRSILNNYASITKQEAKAPVRDRLREAFSATGDTLGHQTLKGMFPAAYQASGLKKTAQTKLASAVIGLYEGDIDPFLDYLFDLDFEKEAGVRRDKKAGKNAAIKFLQEQGLVEMKDGKPVSIDGKRIKGMSIGQLESYVEGAKQKAFNAGKETKAPEPMKRRTRASGKIEVQAPDQKIVEKVKSGPLERRLTPQKRKGRNTAATRRRNAAILRARQKKQGLAPIDRTTIAADNPNQIRIARVPSTKKERKAQKRQRRIETPKSPMSPSASKDDIRSVNIASGGGPKKPLKMPTSAPAPAPAPAPKPPKAPEAPSPSPQAPRPKPKLNKVPSRAGMGLGKKIGLGVGAASALGLGAYGVSKLRSKRENA